MMIEELIVQGFRSLKNITWEPGNLNVVIGPNASGKSNLLGLLELIAASAQGQLYKYIQRHGGISQLAWDGQMDTMHFAFRVFNADQPFTYDFKLGITDATYSIPQERLSSSWQPNDTLQQSHPLMIRLQGQPTRVQSQSGNLLDLPEDSISSTETALSVMTGPFIGDTPASRAKRWFESWRIYHDIDTGPDSEIRKANVTRFETQLEQNGQNLVPVLHSLYSENRDFRSNIDLGMRAAYGEEYEELRFPPAADQRVQMRVAWRSLKRATSAADLSDGTLRFLFLLTVLSSPDKPPLIAIDEPETGLHPGMLPIVAEYAVEASKKTQVIFTTHSPQFLDAFRETKPTVTIAKWENGATKLSMPDAESLGPWLQEYSLGTLYRTGELENMA
jgi:predicted ATPase